MTQTFAWSVGGWRGFAVPVSLEIGGVSVKEIR